MVTLDARAVEFTPVPRSVLERSRDGTSGDSWQRAAGEEVAAWYRPQVYSLLRRHGLSPSAAAGLLPELDALLGSRRAWHALLTSTGRFHGIVARQLAAAVGERRLSAPGPDDAMVPPTLQRLETAHDWATRLALPGNMPSDALHTPLHLAHVLAGSLAILKCRLDRQCDGDYVALLECLLRGELGDVPWAQRMSRATGEPPRLTAATVARLRREVGEFIRATCVWPPVG